MIESHQLIFWVAVPNTPAIECTSTYLKDILLEVGGKRAIKYQNTSYGIDMQMLWAAAAELRARAVTILFARVEET